MSLVEWRSEFETGIPGVDHEHRQLVELVNELPGVLDAQPNAAAMKVLGDIHAAVAAHFALEERMMRESRYDEYREHKADHDRLLDEFRDLMDDYEAGAWVDRDRFAGVVAEWFATHFRTRDARLHRQPG